MCVGISISNSTAVNYHAIIKERAVAFFDGFQPIEQPGELCHVESVDLRDLLHLLAVVAVVRDRMVLVRYTDVRIGAAAQLWWVIPAGSEYRFNHSRRRRVNNDAAANGPPGPHRPQSEHR